MILVSDLHMGAGDDADDFSPGAEEAYLRLLSEYKPERHVGVGDMLEGQQAKNSEIRRAHRAVFDAWRALPKKMTRIPGNHDGSPLPDRLVFQFGGIRVLVIHGHQFDEYNKSGNGLGRYVAQVVGFLERRVHKDVDRWLDKLYAVVKKRVAEYDAGMAALAKESGCSIVVYGHTHFPSLSNVDDVGVVNCGTWTHKFRNGYPYVKIDGNGVVYLKWWE